MRTDILESKEQILEWISQNQSKAFMCLQFNCKPSTLESYLKRMGIDYLGNQGGKGIKIGPHPKTSAYDLSLRAIVSSHKLKLRMISEGIREHKCERCGITEWMGSMTPLELHHINGDRSNNTFENIKLLCPNCHTQTPNFSGKANKKAQVVEW